MDFSYIHKGLIIDNLGNYDDEKALEIPDNLHELVEEMLNEDDTLAWDEAIWLAIRGKKAN